MTDQNQPIPDQEQKLEQATAQEALSALQPQSLTAPDFEGAGS